MSAPAEIHPAARRQFRPWKNGGGQTAEIICHPEGAGFDDFGWRISTARVASSGPFSTFPGVTRSLTVIEGGIVQLSFPDGQREILDPRSAPLQFAGDIACDCVLSGDTVLDLNVMVRAPYRARVHRGGPMDGPAPGVRLIFALRDLPKFGLARHDLARLAVGELVPRLDETDAITIEIDG